jgi:hypothetical protein
LQPSLEKMPLMPVLSWLMAFMALRWRFSYSSALSLVRFRRSSCGVQGKRTYIYGMRRSAAHTLCVF